MRTLLRFCAASSVLMAGDLFLADAFRSSAQVPAVQPGQVLISELRYRGPNGTRDEFIELYNNTDNDIFVQSVDQSGGWSVVASNGEITGPVCTVPNETRIPARGHLLCANTDPDFGSGYSLGGYPSGNPTPAPTASPTPAGFAGATPDRPFIIDDLPDGFGVALFATQSGTNANANTRLDAFGFTQTPAGFKEGNGFPVVPGSGNEHTLYRDLSGGTPKDTQDNAADFRLVATTQSLQTQLLGAPGPENLNSPVQHNADIKARLLDPFVLSSAPPNRERRPNVEPNANLGTLLIRRRFTNNTGTNVTRLRFRVVEITTAGNENSCGTQGQCADLRALSSNNIGQVATSDGSLETVRGVRLEADPPITPNGGGFNSSLSADFVNLSTPLAPGFSINIEFKLGVMRTGPFRFLINVEADVQQPNNVASATAGKKPRARSRGRARAGVRLDSPLDER
ncbi:MAG: lamin tail domain-containing protein [Acidobacteria bacterium]|nr:lamin tail domain-containing protein [Acidobacteriota bacterium]